MVFFSIVMWVYQRLYPSSLQPHWVQTPNDVRIDRMAIEAWGQIPQPSNTVSNSRISSLVSVEDIREKKNWWIQGMKSHMYVITEVGAVCQGDFGTTKGDIQKTPRKLRLSLLFQWGRTAQRPASWRPRMSPKRSLVYSSQSKGQIKPNVSRVENDVLILWKGLTISTLDPFLGLQ